VLANDAAEAMVTGADIWEANANESVAYQYSRFNYNATNFHAATPYAASDHNPEVVGLDVDAPSVENIQILGTNDFHGRLTRNPTGAEAGAAVLAGAVKELRSANPKTVFAAAGDLIGASTFESFIQNDKPTIDALNKAGLEVSAVGNHEFDQGYDDLVNRVMADDNPEGGAEWKYLGANVRFKATGNPALPATWIRDFGDVEVGFVGAVTEHLPELVSPDGIAEIVVTDIVEETNTEAAELKEKGADVVVLLVHEGAATTAYQSAVDPASDFGKIVNGVSADVDAIISGHTHLAYNHRVPVREWAAEDREVTKRPVVSAGQYGYNLNRLRFRVDADTGEVLGIRSSILALQTNDGTGTWTPNYPADAATQEIVDEAVAKAEVLGAQKLGELAGPFNRAKLANGTTENRGGESTLGNLVAEVQRWATEAPNTGSAQIAFMNPGGLRADMVPASDGTVTYRGAANVQPFANTLVNMDLTGAQIKEVLEQQWQPPGSQRPFLRLGASKGFTYTYDPAKPAGSRITGMWLHGDRVEPSETLSVTVNSFLAAGGDDFTAFAGGTGKQDTGQVDLQAMVDYLAEFADASAGDPPLPVDYSQRAVGVAFPAGAPAEYAPGSAVAFSLSSLAMSAPTDAEDASVTVSLGGTPLGSFPVDNTVGTDVFDEYGTASVNVTIPAGTPGGATSLVVSGAQTGTLVIVPVTVSGGGTPPGDPTPTTVSGTAEPFTYGEVGSVAATVTPAAATGTVQVLDGGTVLGSATLSGGQATVPLPAESLAPGSHQLTLRYSGSESHAESSSTVTVIVEKVTPTMTVRAPKRVEKGDRAEVKVKLDAGDVPVTGEVELRIEGGDTLTRRVKDERVEFKLPRASGREIKATVVYLGNDLVDRAEETITIKVVR
jgi:5'-nucleotidase